MLRNETPDWLKGLGSGDEVGIYLKISGTIWIGTILFRSERILVVSANGKEYTFPASGCTGYGAAASKRLCELTPELRAELGKGRLLAQVKKLDFSRCSEEVLRQVLALVNEERGG